MADNRYTGGRCDERIRWLRRPSPNPPSTSRPRSPRPPHAVHSRKGDPAWPVRRQRPTSAIHALLEDTSTEDQVQADGRRAICVPYRAGSGGA